MKAGIIILWYGIAANVPYGWKICNGQFGTPDLRDRIPVCAGLAYAVGNVGGPAAHDHPFTGDGHRHGLVAYTGVFPGALDYRVTSQYTEYEPAVGDTDPVSSMPKYHSLYYIMRM